MKLSFQFLSVVCHLFTLSLSDHVNENDLKPVELELKDTNSNYRKLPIFPKNSFKFVVTPSPKSIVYTHKPKDHIMPKKTLKSLFTPNPKDETLATTQLPKRKPLMKLRTFTIKSRANGKFDGVVTSTRRNSMHSAINQVTKKPIQLPEEVSNNGINLSYLHKRDNKFKQEIRDAELKQKKANTGYLNPEEEQDRNEIIFLESADQIQDVQDISDITGQQLDNDLAATTEFTLYEKAARFKR